MVLILLRQQRREKPGGRQNAWPDAPSVVSTLPPVPGVADPTESTAYARTSGLQPRRHTASATIRRGVYQTIDNAVDIYPAETGMKFSPNVPRGTYASAGRDSTPGR